MQTASTKKKRYTITVNDDMAQIIKSSAKALNVTPSTYVWLCIEGRGRLLQENSNLKARLKDASIKYMPPPTFD